MKTTLKMMMKVLIHSHDGDDVFADHDGGGMTDADPTVTLVSHRFRKTAILLV